MSLKKNITFLAVTITYAILSYKFIEVLDSLKGTQKYGIIFLVTAGSLFIIFIAFFISKLFQTKYSECLGAIICILPILSKFPIKFNLYTDSAGRPNYFTFTCFLITFLLIFIILNSNLKRVKNLWKFQNIYGFPFILFLIIVSFIATQIYNLGFVSGMGIVLLRIGIPAFFLICTILSINSYRDIYVIFSCIIISMIIAVIMSLIGTTITDSFSGMEGMFIQRVQVEGFASWTMFGTLLSLTLPLCMLYYLNSTKPIIKFSMIFLILLFSYEILNTYTRGSILSSSIIFIFFLNKRIRKDTNLYTILFLLIATLIISYPFIYQKILLRPWYSQIHMDSSIGARIDRITEAYHFVKSNIFLGIGFGKPKSNHTHEIAYYVYNGYLSWWVFSGITGMLSFIYLHLNIMRASFKSSKSACKDELLIGLTMFAIMLGWFINQMTTADQLIYFNSIESVCYFFIHVGIVSSIKNATKVKQLSNKVVFDKPA